jgi:murein DD-endopeptidase MepM/ murein hydrolase activator NlpD
MPGGYLKLPAKPMRRAGDLLLAKVGGALGSAFLIGDPRLGILLWVALTAGHLRSLIFGLFGLWVGDLIGRLIGVLDKPALGGGVRANAILGAIAVAWLTSGSYTPVETEIVLATLAASSAGLITAALMGALAETPLPPMVLGFSIVAGVLFTLFPLWVESAASTLLTWPAPVNALADAQIFIRSLGSLVFSPTLAVGVVVGLALLLWSRIIFFAGFVGWLAGALTSIELQGLSVPFYWQPASYNFFIAGMALGAAFFLPGWPSLGLAVVGGMGAAVLAALIQHMEPAWAFLPLSAIGIIWICLTAFTLSKDTAPIRRNEHHDIPPEQAWVYAIDHARRFGGHEPLLVVPFAGAVQITQGFNGQLSHAGAWRYALDFQRPPGESIWDTPITAPAAGMVERVRDNVPDNELGICNYAENWGNYVLLRMDQGGWALLAHLKQSSIAVVAGARVELGAYLAKVGNSGRSPVPHLHLQVQNSPYMGAPASPFRLANYETRLPGHETGPFWRESGVPQEQTILAASWPEPAAYQILTSLAPGSAVWTVAVTGKLPPHFRQPDGRGKIEHITTRLDMEGQHILSSSYGDGLVLHLDPDAWRIREIHRLRAPLLRLLALAVPSIPYAARSAMEWQEPALAWAFLANPFSLSLSPYRRLPVPEMRCICLETPNTETRVLVVESTPIRQASFLPTKITCTFQRLRGPVKVEAVFDTGSVIYEQLSFEPGLPF